jgi:transposase
MLMGETSRLPVYQVVYAGSLKDVSALESTLSLFDAVTGGKPVLAVMDKGFYSKRNVDNMLFGDNKRFIVSVPFTSGFAKKQVESERKDMDSVQNTIMVCGESMRAVTKERVWDRGRKVFTHIFYAPGKAFRRREDIYAHVAMLRDEAEMNPGKHALETEYRKYLNIRKSSDAESGYTINIGNDAVDAALGTSGWLVIISNDVRDAKRALQIYRAKDVVEKGFLRLKCDIDMGRLRVHNWERMQSKVFIGFIALVLLSGIHAVMSDRKLYDKMTMKQLLRTLAKQRVQYIGNERIVFPATKTQKEIYKAFDVSEPT